MPPQEPQYVRLREARQLYTLLGECLAVGQDGIAWRWRLTKAIRRMLDAQMAFFADHLVVGEPESPQGWLRPLSIVDDWEEEQHRDRFWEFIGRGRHERSPFSGMDRACTTHNAALRREVVDDSTWCSSRFYKDYLVTTGLDDCINSTSRMPEGVIQVLFVQRRHDAAPFERAAVNLIDNLWKELRQLQPDRLVDIHESAFLSLSKRMLQVLACVLSGYTAKETASLIGVSTHTAQEHIRRLYKRSGASNRAELAACYRTIAPVLINTPLERLPDVSERIERATRAPWPREPGRNDGDPPGG